MDGPERSSASERWRALVEARIAAVEEVAPGSAGLCPAFWDARAHHWATRMTDFEQHEPFVTRLREVVGPDTILVDVGAGSGRFALPLAAVAREVVAVDSSRVMLDLLRGEAQQRGVNNVRAVQGAWQEVVLDEAGRQRVFVYDQAVDDYAELLRLGNDVLQRSARDPHGVARGG